MTAWSAAGSDFREWRGIRIPHRLQAAWHPPESAFTYFQSEITSIDAFE
jgi:hypothetical protein